MVNSVIKLLICKGIRFLQIFQVCFVHRLHYGIDYPPWAVRQSVRWPAYQLVFVSLSVFAIVSSMSVSPFVYLLMIGHFFWLFLLFETVSEKNEKNPTMKSSQQRRNERTCIFIVLIIQSLPPQFPSQLSPRLYFWQSTSLCVYVSVSLSRH